MFLGFDFENMIRELYGYWCVVVSDWSGIGIVYWFEICFCEFGYEMIFVMYDIICCDC